MRPRDLTKSNWRGYPNTISLRSGVGASIGWATGTIDFSVDTPAAQCSIIVPRKIFDKMSDWYVETCDATFWKTSKEFANTYFGELIPDKRKEWADYPRREWQISASPYVLVEDKDGVCRIPRVNRMVMIRGEGLKEQISVIFIRRGEFDRIVRWYNSEYETSEKAA